MLLKTRASRVGGWKFGAGSKCREVFVVVVPVCVQIKANGQKLQQVIGLLIIVIGLRELLFLGFWVVQKSLNEITLPGLGELLAVLLEDALDAALLCGGDPLESVLFRFMNILEIDPVGVVVLVLPCVRY